MIKNQTDGIASIQKKMEENLPSLKQSINFALEDIQTTLEYLDEQFPNQGLPELLESIENKLQLHEMSMDDIATHHFFLVTEKNRRDPDGEKRTKMWRALILACAYASLAKAFLASNKTVLAWHTLSRAEYYCGLVEGLSYPVIDGKTKRARKGGETAARNAKHVQKVIIDLLISQKPATGWRNIRTCAEVLADHVLEMAEKEKLSLPRGRNDLIHFIENFIYDDKDAQNAFNQSG